MSLTLEERERRAYANGWVRQAELLGLALEPVNQAILDLDYEVRSLKEDNQRLRKQLDNCEC